MRRPAALLLLTVALSVLAAFPRAQAETVPLARALATLDADDLVEIHTRSGPPLRGHPLATLRDTLHLKGQAADTVRFAVPLDGILLVRRWESNAGRGARAGAVSGLVLAGGYGALLGAYLSTWDGDDGDVVAGALVGFALVGAVGAAGGGLVGVGIGALSHSWSQVWPEAEPPPAPEFVRAPPGETRLGLFGGVAQSLLENYEVTRFSARVSLRRDLGSRWSLGPEIGYDDFDGQVLRSGARGEAVLGTESIVRVALSTVIRSPRPGRAPYATGGVGWFLSNDAYLGAYLGGGLQWRRSGGNDLALDLRYNFGLREVDPGQVASYWTAGLSIGFGL